MTGPDFFAQYNAEWAAKLKASVEAEREACAQIADKCQMPGCGRHGVRGNENIIGGTVMCDYCHAAILERTETVHSGDQTDETAPGNSCPPWRA